MAQEGPAHREDVQEALVVAAEDAEGIQARRELAEALSWAFRAGGKALWVGGAMIGPDRAAGESPFEFGSDATVGVAAILQIAGELVRGATALFEDGNRYGAAALVRQLVEAEYLLGLSRKAKTTPRNGCAPLTRSVMQLFRPYQLREQSGGLFRHGDYSHHCGKGGHPSPEGLFLLPGHPGGPPEAVFRCDMNLHGLNIWDFAVEAAGRLGHAEVLGPIGESSSLNEVRGRWRDEDDLIVILDWLTANQDKPGFRDEEQD